MKKPIYILSGMPEVKINTTVKRVFIRRNQWDNFGLFVGNKKVYDSAEFQDCKEYAAQYFPNAQIINKTIF